MTAHQTKFFKRKEVSFPILLGIFGVSTLLVLHLFGVFSHAAPITDDDKVTVDGVENVGQYLTSLVLHAPSSSQLITIQYDKTLDALRVNGRINADALVIDAGQKDNNSSVQGNALFGGMGNSVDGKTSNNLIVGGENNSIKNFVNGNDRDIQGKNSVVIGSTNSEIRTSDNVLNIGTMNSSFSNKTKNVAAIGGQVIAQNAENSVALGAGKKTLASNAMLLGKSINAEAKNQIFVWSDTDAEFRPEQSSAFYVNTTNGFGLNTTTPRTKLDLANAGALKIAKTQPKHCSQSLAGITSYAGDVFCGCNGKEWIPLTSDMTPEKIAACKNLGKENCVGEVNTNANKGAPSAYPRWNHELDQWEPIGWKYSSKDPNTLGDCEYNCKLGFHPGANDPEGWLQLGACKACSEVMNKFRWKTAGTGDDNCDFTCKASFKYANEGKGKQSCSDCELGTYTENDNQDKTCKACDKPAKLWRDKPGSDPYFSGFTTKGDGANACDFDCAPRYQHFFNGKKSDKDKVSIGLNGTVNGNACIFCEIGTWSAGGKNVCANCTNKPEQIEYSVNNVKYSLSNFSSYTSNGSTNHCEWKCDASKGLEKNGNLCKCRANQHLEGAKCIANSMKAHCTNPAPANDEGVIKGKSDYDRQWIGDRNRGSRSVTHSWTYRENVSSPGICQWSCKTGYERSGNTCVKQATQYEWKCLKVEGERGYCSLPGENPNPFGPLGGSHSGGDSTAHKGCFFATKEACEKSGKCQWYSGGDAPSFTGEIPSCVDKSAPDDRTKDSKNPDRDCKGPIPDCGSAKWECESSCEVIDERWCQEKRLDRNYSESGYRCWIKQGGTYIWRYNDWGFYKGQSNTVGGGSYPWGKCTYCAVSSYFKDVCDVPSSQKIPDYCAWVDAMPISKDCSGNSKKECEGATEAEQRKKWYCSWESNYVCKKNGRIAADVECDGKVKPKNCGETTPVAYSCLGSLPVNAIANNSNKPTSSNKNYFYSTNASEPCSFQCKEGYNWKDGFCVKNVKYEWKCIYHDPSGLGGKCVLKASGTTPSEKGCLQQLPGHYVQCNKSGRGDHYSYCTIKLKGACSYSKENCEKCKGELGGGKPYWFEGLSFDSCNGIKTQEECGKRTECKWENDKFGFVPREVPVCVDKSAPNDRSKDSKNPNIDCPGIPPSCGISINFDKNCKNTKIYTGWSSSGGFVNHHFEVFANVDSGCSIRNIRYEDTDYCGNFSKVLSISGDIKNSGYQIPLPSHEPSISFENYPQWENDKRSRKYTYDVYSGEERVSPDKELLIKAIPCISGKPGATCLMPYACN